MLEMDSDSMLYNQLKNYHIMVPYKIQMSIKWKGVISLIFWEV